MFFVKWQRGLFPLLWRRLNVTKPSFSRGSDERVYFLLRGAVKLSRVYEAGEEITVALLRENSVFGVLSLLTGNKSDRFYHAVAFTAVELLSSPIEQVEQAPQGKSRTVNAYAARPLLADSANRNDD